MGLLWEESVGQFEIFEAYASLIGLWKSSSNVSRGISLRQNRVLVNLIRNICPDILFSNLLSHFAGADVKNEDDTFTL